MKNKIVMLVLSLVVTVSLMIVGCAPEAAPPAEEGAPPPEEEEEAAPTTEKATYEWRLAILDPPEEDSVKSCNRFAECVKKASEGRIDIDVYHSGVLGDWVPVQGEVMKGSIEMELTCLAGEWDRRLEAALLPYLVSTHEEVSKAYGPGGDILALFDDIAAETDIKIVSGWDMGFNGFAFSKLPPNYADVNANKHCKMRIASNKMREIMATRFGYTPTVIPWTDAFQAMQTGLVDGVIGGTANLCYAHFRDVMTDWVQMNEVYQAYFYIMNLDLWDSLSDKDRAIVQECANEEAVWSFSRGKERDQEYLQKLSDYGITIDPLTPEQLAAYATATREDIWPELSEMYGPKVMDTINAFLAEQKSS